MRQRDVGPLVSVNLPPHRDERLVNEVLGPDAIVHQPNGKAQRQRRGGVEQLGESLGITGAKPAPTAPLSGRRTGRWGRRVMRS